MNAAPASAMISPFPEPRPVTLSTLEEGAGLPPPPTLRDALMTSAELLENPIPERQRILGHWLREGDLGYLFAPRGHGKTWLAMLIANAIAEGAPLGEWARGEQPHRVVYFDAEMNLPDVRARAALIGIRSPRFIWMQNEKVFEKLRRSMNISDSTDQQEISASLREGDVLIIDNLSTASCGMKENDNDDFDLIKNWLLSLRNRRITVIIVHHAGRNGEMRGASRREDMAHWILSLKDDSGEADSKVFITTFRKCRNCPQQEVPPLRWLLSTLEGQLTPSCVPHSGMDAMLALIQEGVETAGELADELNVTVGCISKWAKKLADRNRVTISNRRYRITQPVGRP